MGRCLWWEKERRDGNKRSLLLNCSLLSKTTEEQLQKQVWWAQKQLWSIFLRQNFPVWQQNWLWPHAPSTWWSICSALSSSESTTRYSSFPLRWNSWSDLWGKQLWRWQAVTRVTQAKTKRRSSRCRTHGWMSQHHWPEQTVLNDCVFFTTAWQLEAVVLSRESKLSVNYWNYFQRTYLDPGRPAGGHGTRRPRGLHHLSLSGCPLDWMPSCYWSPRRGQSSTRTRDRYRY